MRGHELHKMHVVQKYKVLVKERIQMDFIVEKILKGSLDLILSSSLKIQIMGGKVCLRCKFKTSKLLKTKQCFALLPQVSFPANNLNFY